MRTLHFSAIALLAAVPALAGPTFSVTFDKSLRPDPATGRLIIYMVAEASGISGPPASGPFWEDPQSLYGVDVDRLAPGAAAEVADSATSFPVPLSKLPQGRYRIQAVLDLHQDNSEWKREPGNLYSDPQTIAIGDTDGPTVFSIALTHAVAPRRLPDAPGVEWLEIPSKLLSDFHNRPVTLRAGVALPIGYDPKADRTYPAVYEVPGFGGDHTEAVARAARSRLYLPGSSQGRLARNCFWIVPDPESGNGHTLWADSANNGPVGQALTTELIPALEAKYKLIAAPSARLLRGHSSGGWSTLWLALTYPTVFGATWSTSPDPVDFHKFQLPDIYGTPNMYGSSSPFPSFRVGGVPKMTIRQENLMEEVLGPDNTSGQQWDSWQAVFSPRNDRGHPAALYDPQTGAIDHAIADQYKKFDITTLLQEHPDRYLPLFRDNVRIVVGDQDSFYLNEAVALLKQHVDELNSKAGQTPGWGKITIVSGLDHGTIMQAPEIQSIPDQMLDRLERAGHIPAAK